MSPDRDDRSGAPDPDVDALFAQIVAGWDDDDAPPVPPWPATEDLTDRGAPPAPTARGDGTSGGSTPPADADPAGGEHPTSPGIAGQPRDRPGGGPADRSRAVPGRPAPGRSTPGRDTPGRDTTGRDTTGRDTTGRDAPGPPAPGPRDWDATEEPDEGYVPPEPPPLPRGDLVSRLAWAGVLLGPAFLLLSALVWDGAGPLPLALAALAFIGGFVTLVARLPARRDDEDDDGAVV